MNNPLFCSENRVAACLFSPLISKLNIFNAHDSRRCFYQNNNRITLQKANNFCRQLNFSPIVSFLIPSHRFKIILIDTVITGEAELPGIFYRIPRFSGHGKRIIDILAKFKRKQANSCELISLVKGGVLISISYGCHPI